MDTWCRNDGWMFAGQCVCVCVNVYILQTDYMESTKTHFVITKFCRLTFPALETKWKLLRSGKRSCRTNREILRACRFVFYQICPLEDKVPRSHCVGKVWHFSMELLRFCWLCGTWRNKELVKCLGWLWWCHCWVAKGHNSKHLDAAWGWTVLGCVLDFLFHPFWGGKWILRWPDYPSALMEDKWGFLRPSWASLLLFLLETCFHTYILLDK